MRITYYKLKDTDEKEVIGIREAKKLLKSQGGHAWTEVYERDGTMCDVIPVELKGNNSNIKMNHHL